MTQKRLMRLLLARDYSADIADLAERRRRVLSREAAVRRKIRCLKFSARRTDWRYRAEVRAACERLEAELWSLGRSRWELNVCLQATKLKRFKALGGSARGIKPAKSRLANVARPDLSWIGPVARNVQERTAP